MRQARGGDPAQRVEGIQRLSCVLIEGGLHEGWSRAVLV